MSDEGPHFDLLCLGRLGVDLYGEQEGAPLAAVQTFVKYLGGSAANVCVGSSRLGLSTAMCSRVGDEGFGDFVLDTLAREGVDTSLVQRDSLHPTGVVTLALNRREGFPRIFFYTDSADLSFDETAVDWSILDRSDALLLTGSYLVDPKLEACSRALATHVRSHGGRVLLDIDYRPVLWGRVPVGQGNDMATSDPEVTEVYQRMLSMCDLVVGTVEEITVAGGSTDLPTSLSHIRGLTDAPLVVKNGAAGATVYVGEVRSDLSDGLGGPGYSVDVLNSTGAGDAFLSGFLSQWLRGRPLDECVQSGNACGAIVVTRHGCMPAMPFADELALFMDKGGVRRPDDDEDIERAHRMGSRRPVPPWQCLVSLEESALTSILQGAGGSVEETAALRQQLLEAVLTTARDATGSSVGVVVDRFSDRESVEESIASGLFVLKTIESEKLNRISPEQGEELGAEIRTWPVEVVARAEANLATPRSGREDEARWMPLTRLAMVCRRQQRELLIDLGLVADASSDQGSVVTLLDDAYSAGLRPDYWAVPSSSDPHQMRRIEALLRERDPSCRGFFLLRRQEDSRDAFEDREEDHLFRGVVLSDPCDESVVRAWAIDKANDEDVKDAVKKSIANFL